MKHLCFRLPAAVLVFAIFLLSVEGLARYEVEGSEPAQPRKPNFIIILCDDLGYGDVEPFGGSIPTPNLNRMAHEGVAATDYYAPANICTPSRAGLLTGRYAVRAGLGYEVILYGDDRVLPLSEKTIAAVLKPDYATGLFGIVASRPDRADLAADQLWLRYLLWHPLQPRHKAADGLGY